jgi:hypothetical protein
LVERKESEFSLRNVAHIRPDNSTAETRAAALNAFQEIIKPCVVQGKDGAIEISTGDSAPEPQFCLVTLLRKKARSSPSPRHHPLPRPGARQQRLMSMQLVAGYFDLYMLRRQSEQSQIVAQSHQHVLQLATAVATAEGFESAAMNLCNELATRTGATRVALGWIKGQNVRVKALSHTEQFDKKQELVKIAEKVDGRVHRPGRAGAFRSRQGGGTQKRQPRGSGTLARRGRAISCSRCRCGAAPKWSARSRWNFPRPTNSSQQAATGWPSPSICSRRSFTTAIRTTAG